MKILDETFRFRNYEFMNTFNSHFTCENDEKNYTSKIGKRFFYTIDLYFIQETSKYYSQVFFTDFIYST